ncbi:uncharacterized protein LOC110307196 [Mus caroli]|uniref:Uncharacterized protein LOC110307196 n=1 Tax=Mus caroli TaxID=10089 RepID=A0A6P7QD19_MUSCR|nr:uncharacterized protein LOC110307196 [Mus caroli]
MPLSQQIVMTTCCMTVLVPAGHGGGRCPPAGGWSIPLFFAITSVIKGRNSIFKTKAHHPARARDRDMARGEETSTGCRSRKWNPQVSWTDWSQKLTAWKIRA